MSPRTLHRLFLAHFGENVSDYLRKLRIGHACLLLLETDISVSSIALKVGFRNLSNFNRAFQKTRKMTPMDLRRFVKEHGRLPKPADNATTTWHDVSDSERSFILQRDRQRQIPA
jgi:AraC-like DNA-binding protein